MLIVILSAAEHVRLVHANVDQAAGKALGHRTEHALDQFVDPVIAHKKYVAHIVMLFCSDKLKLDTERCITGQSTV